MALADPSHAIPQELMSHVHLISSFRYPTMMRFDPNEVAKWLLSAPQIARDRAPFFWTYLDKPADGTILLMWQPLAKLGTNFATDGFVWAPPEQVYKHNLGNGLILEIYYLKAGHIPGEQHALHARRRFRLVPIPGHPNPPQVDVSLFIVHYGPSEPNDRLPASAIPGDDRVKAIMQQRSYLMRNGQIRRKEFMLADRVNWPSLPELTRQQMAPHSVPLGIPQQMAYPPHQPHGSSATRTGHGQHQSQHGVMPGMPANEAAGAAPLPFDDEDTTRGDMFDRMTQREISMTRYQQNHEWMEEILASAYQMNRITPADLNLGLKGELAPLTEGIFSAQGAEAIDEHPEKPYVWHLDPDLADEFRQRVTKHIETTQADMEKMKEAYLEELAKIKRSSIFKDKEAELRKLGGDFGLEMLRSDAMSDGADYATRRQSHRKILDDITREIEAATGCKIVAYPRVKRVQDGGYQPSAHEQPAASLIAQMSRQPSHVGSQNSGLVMGDSEVDMGGTAAGLDQMQPGDSSLSTPANNFPTPLTQPPPTAQSRAGSSANSNNASGLASHQTPYQPATQVPPTQQAPAAASIASQAPTTVPEAPPAQPSSSRGDVVTSGESGGQASAQQDSGVVSNDWVVVPKGGEGSQPGTPGGEKASLPATGNPEIVRPPNNGPAAAAAPAEAATTSFDHNDFNSLGDLDTAGEVLTSYETTGLDATVDGGLGDDLDLDMDMDDSAFGDALHGVDAAGGGV